ncbi:hypothetical protein HK098_000318 [Nowakowskiella sp. JEL0407]|nr:hypothetical protein HK098_000318 [Nowakowskiella sp. JEL0407]
MTDKTKLAIEYVQRRINKESFKLGNYEIKLKRLQFDPEEALNFLLEIYPQLQKTSAKGFRKVTTQVVKLRAKITRKHIGLEDFRLHKVLGRGSFGKVILAQDFLTGKHHAIKAIKKVSPNVKNYAEMLWKENRVLQQIVEANNPFLVSLHSVFQTDTRVCLVMEYAQGGSLFSLLNNRDFTETDIKFYAIEMLLGLEGMHEQGILYRDLKLENVLLGADGHVKLSDYGLCKEQMGAGDRTNSICGTPHYTAPEVIEGLEYGRAADWWSLGVILYTMAMNKYPFFDDDEDADNTNFANVLVHIYKSVNDLDYFNDHSDDFVSLLTKLLQINPIDRIGGEDGDVDQIKGHRFFVDVDWEAYAEKQIDSLWVPKLKQACCARNYLASQEMAPVDRSNLINWIMKLHDRTINCRPIHVQFTSVKAKMMIPLWMAIKEIDPSSLPDVGDFAIIVGCSMEILQEGEKRISETLNTQVTNGNPLTLLRYQVQCAEIPVH